LTSFAGHPITGRGAWPFSHFEGDLALERPGRSRVAASESAALPADPAPCAYSPESPVGTVLDQGGDRHGPSAAVPLAIPPKPLPQLLRQVGKRRGPADHTGRQASIATGSAAALQLGRHDVAEFHQSETRVELVVAGGPDRRRSRDGGRGRPAQFPLSGCWPLRRAPWGASAGAVRGLQQFSTSRHSRCKEAELPFTFASSHSRSFSVAPCNR